MLRQRVNRLMHAKREFEKAKRQYHKAAFLVLYGENQNRNHLTRHEENIIRQGIPGMKRAYMANRVLTRFLPASLRRNILQKAHLI
jgi:hypothetical protein